MVSKGGATWGLRKSTLREGLGRVWVRFAPWTKMDSKGNSIWLEKKFLNFVKNHVLSDILGDADWLTIPLSLHPPHALWMSHQFYPVATAGKETLAGKQELIQQELDLEHWFGGGIDYPRPLPLLPEVCAQPHHNWQRSQLKPPGTYNLKVMVNARLWDNLPGKLQSFRKKLFSPTHL